MKFNRILLSATLIVVALVVQVSVLARLQLPGAVPDLVLLTVVGLALVYGPVSGSLIGFSAGLLADLAPPADHAAGRYALVLCVIGYLVGLARPENGRLALAVLPSERETEGVHWAETGERHAELTAVLSSDLDGRLVAMARTGGGRVLTARQRAGAEGLRLDGWRPIG